MRLAQFEVNNFILHAVRNENLELDDLDAFQREIVWPKKDQSKRLGPRFFQTRVVMNCNSHLRAYASECSQAVSTLVLLFETVYEPRGIMLLHGRCLKKMHYMLSILRMGDKAVQHTAALRELIRDHHDDFLALYGIKCAKIKKHLLFHIPDCLDKFQINLDCFKPERMHKGNKQYGTHITHENIGTYVLERALLDKLDNVEDRWIVS